MSFRAMLVRFPGKGGWTFVEVPFDQAPSVTHGWGRTPVVATVDGRTWQTSTWREKNGRTMLPVPKAIRSGKGHGDEVTVSLVVREDED